MKKKPIPTFIIEEHHEAFIVWNYAIQQGLIPPTGNALFHVDEHSDMGTPRLNRSIHELNGDLDTIKDFTYKELNIASFIMPAIYINLFDQIHWIRQKHRKPEIRHEEMYIRSYNQSGKRLISGKINTLKEITPDPDRKKFDYYLRTIEQIPDKKNVVLDIDLDYFSCSGNPNELEEIYIEITKKEFQSFKQNKYHRLNYVGIGRIEAVHKDKRYYYLINNYNEIYPSNSNVSEEIIIIRINRLIEKLKEKQIRPTLIVICHSCHSGYTPKNQVDFIQNNLINELKQLYEIKVTNTEIMI